MKESGGSEKYLKEEVEVRCEVGRELGTDQEVLPAESSQPAGSPSTTFC